MDISRKADAGAMHASARTDQRSRDASGVVDNGTIDTRVTLSGWMLDNPVLAASGTFGYGQEYAEIYDINVLGSFSFKGTTLHPRFGNEQPRIAESASGMLNAVGLQNPGIDAVIAEELPALQRVFHKKVIANISGFSIEEYVECCRRIDAVEQVGLIELNVSCPNVHAGGANFGTSPDTAAAVTEAVRRVTSKPLYVKLTPNVTDIVAIAKACWSAGADGFSLINTLVGTRIDIRTGKPVLANRTGGLSGPAVFPVALHLVSSVASALDVPVIGMGGVSSAEDVVEMMMAGATAVAIGSENLRNPTACRDIVLDLPDVMKRLGIAHLADIIGCAVP